MGEPTSIEDSKRLTGASKAVERAVMTDGTSDGPVELGNQICM